MWQSRDEARDVGAGGSERGFATLPWTVDENHRGIGQGRGQGRCRQAAVKGGSDHTG